MCVLTVHISHHTKLSFYPQLLHKKKENIVQQGPKVRPYVHKICAVIVATTNGKSSPSLAKANQLASPLFCTTLAKLAMCVHNFMQSLLQ